MTTEQNTGNLTAESIEQALLSFLETRTKASVSPTQELFASGLVSSMFAMELVVHLEQNYGIAIVGSDLKTDNFRTVRMMTELVLRLRGASSAVGDA
ncbi:methoxymalonate biosynthesis protein [Streptomyces sp. NTH33]|uniref:acyl carrier protein n=1 Tax=Streptomyces sp. NTH33 TaxID=1735453 RepID=UPI000DA7E7CC|nr:phosphopantetheine-binding protein [Streptomyces sp. NTH33]PZH08629.1 methoxymalonate biosynthesis protein [Streptomyces sp. NTH33]